MNTEDDRFPACIDDQVEFATRCRLAEIGVRARQRLRELAGEFARATDPKRERLLAEIEFERWLAESCEEDLS